MYDIDLLRSDTSIRLAIRRAKQPAKAILKSVTLTGAESALPKSRAIK